MPSTDGLFWLWGLNYWQVVLPETQKTLEHVEVGFVSERCRCQARAWHPEGTSWKAMECSSDNSVGGYHPVLTCSSQVPTACPLPCLSRPAEGSSNRPVLLGKGVDGEGLGCLIRQDEPGWARLHCGEGGRGSTETHFWHQLLLSPCPRPTQVGKNQGW